MLIRYDSKGMTTCSVSPCVNVEADAPSANRLVLVNMCVQCSCACGCIDKHLEGDVATTLNSLTSVGRSGGTKVAAPVTVPRIYPATKYVVFLAPPVNQCRQYLVEVL